MSASTIGFSAPHIVGLFPWITSLPIPPFNQDHVIKQVFQRMGRKYIAEQRGEKHSDKSILSILLREASGKMNEQTLLDNVGHLSHQHCAGSPFFRSLPSCSSHSTHSGLAALLTVASFAGSETSATTISWTLLSLARNPKVQSKLRAELSDVVFEWSALENLPYLDAVFKEACVRYLLCARRMLIRPQTSLSPSCKRCRAHRESRRRGTPPLSHHPQEREGHRCAPSQKGAGLCLFVCRNQQRPRALGRGQR